MKFSPLSILLIKDKIWIVNWIVIKCSEKELIWPKIKNSIASQKKKNFGINQAKWIRYTYIRYEELLWYWLNRKIVAFHYSRATQFVAFTSAAILFFILYKILYMNPSDSVHKKIFASDEYGMISEKHNESTK